MIDCDCESMSELNCEWMKLVICDKLITKPNGTAIQTFHFDFKILKENYCPTPSIEIKLKLSLLKLVYSSLSLTSKSNLFNFKLWINEYRLTIAITTVLE